MALRLKNLIFHFKYFWSMGRDGILAGRDETRKFRDKTRQISRKWDFRNALRDNSRFSRFQNLETRRDETAFLVSSRREILVSKFLDPPLKGMFDARKNFCNPMYFDLSVYSKATPSPPLKVRSLIKLHCNGKKVRDSCCLSLEGG